MADLARIKNNVRKMVEQNAPEADIDGYIASEGVTLDDVRNFRTDRGHTGVPEFRPVGVEGYNPETGEVEPQFSRAGSAVAGAADIGSFGFGDEIASYIGSWISGDPREQVLEEIRGNQQAAQEQNPGSYLAGQIAGGLGQVAATGGAGFGPAMARGGAGLGRVALGSAADGAIYGAGYGAGSANGDIKDRLAGAIMGAGIGGATGAVLPAVTAGASKAARTAVTPFRTSPERVAAADTLRAEGVPVTAGQLTGSRGLRFSESELGGRKAANIMDEQADAFTSAVLRRAGIDSNRATPEVLDNAFTSIGQRFDDLAASNSLTPDQPMMAELRTVFNEYGQTVPESMRAPIVENLTRDIVAAARRGPISGASYQNLTSRIAKAARGASNPDLKGALYGIREALDNAMERSIATNNPAQAGAWRQAREQYRNLLAIEQAATRAGEGAAEGIISPANIRNAAVNQGRRAYARGQGDFADLARSGSMLLSPLPDSGTAGRLKAQNLAALGPMVGGAIVGGGAGAYQQGDMTGALVGAGLGAMAPRAAGSALMSRPVQRYLSNQTVQSGSNPIREAIAAALLRGGTLPAIQGR